MSFFVVVCEMDDETEVTFWALLFPFESKNENNFVDIDMFRLQFPLIKLLQVTPNLCELWEI